MALAKLLAAVFGRHRAERVGTHALILPCPTTTLLTSSTNYLRIISAGVIVQQLLIA